MWVGEALLILRLFQWLFHESWTLYLLMIPWTILGVIMVIRPNWVIRATKAFDERMERDMQRFDKWNPPGFP